MNTKQSQSIFEGRSRKVSTTFGEMDIFSIRKKKGFWSRSETLRGSGKQQPCKFALNENNLIAPTVREYHRG